MTRQSLQQVMVLALLAVAGTTQAQPISQTPYERVLVPITVSAPLPGAYGSVWTTALTVRNDSDEAVVVTTTPVALCGECPPVPPRTTFNFPLVVPDQNLGAFVYVGSPGFGKVTFMLRVQDVSRQAQTWGTQIPVVRERNVYTGKLQLLDIPVDSHSRSALRVYDFDPPAPAAPRAVRLRIYDMCGIGPIDSHCSNDPLVDSVLTLATTPESSEAYPDHPAGAMIGNLIDAFPQLASVPPTVLPSGKFRPASVRIDIDAFSPGLRFWAFVSATNNETQHVTTIAP